MYNHYYGFSEKPFSLTPDPHFLFLSSVHKRALAYLLYGLEDKKGFITITGEIGAGKTTIIQALVNRLDSATNVLAKIVNPKVSAYQLLRMIIRDFGIDCHNDSKDELLDTLNKFLLTQYGSGRSAVLIIDEAQNLEPSSLEEIRLLSNLETEKDKLIQIILVGQPELRGLLALPELRQLRQRITIGYHILPLSKPEVTDYIRHRLSVAGLKGRDLFTGAATEEIFNVSRGIPRLVNIICDATLVTGYVEGIKEIDQTLVQEVIQELDIEQQTAAIVDEGPSPNPQKYKELYNQSHNLVSWRELREKERELDNRWRTLYERLEFVLEREKELAVREERIKSKELELGLCRH